MEGQVKAESKTSIFVGYGAELHYAIYVHEDLTKHHPIGQAKFLEQPFLQYQRQMFDIVKASIRKGLKEGKKRKFGLIRGLFEAGHFLLRKSKPLVPVETGALRASGFVNVG